MVEEITIKVKSDGTLFLETAGYAGNACETKVNEIMKEMESHGIKMDIKEKKKKVEYYAAGTKIGTGNLSKGR